MQERHADRQKYFDEQAVTTDRYVIPFILQVRNLKPGARVLEIGCGEGGNLKPFLDRGFRVTGVDILEGKIRNAEKFFNEHVNRQNLNLICADIYNPPAELSVEFDLVFMRDVLEHIHDQEKFLAHVKRFLKEDGLFFLGFPPWENPFGGHQQMCHSRILSKLPWIHLLPGRLYPGLLKLFGEPEGRIADLMEIRETRISIGRFKKIARKENFKIRKEVYWFINPNYEVKFGLKPRKMPSIVAGIPFLRNFVITTNYFVLSL